MNHAPATWISKLRIENFKSIQSAELDFGPLTVLVGANSAGKSSVLQTLVLLSQIVRERGHSSLVNLNGAELQLGTFADIKNSQTRSRGVGLSIDLYSPDDASPRTRRQLRARQSDTDDSFGQVISWGIVLGRPDSTQMGSARITRAELGTNIPEGAVHSVFDPVRQTERLEAAVIHYDRLRRYRRAFGHFGLSRSVDAGELFNARVTAPSWFQRGPSYDAEAPAKGSRTRTLLSILDSGLPRNTFKLSGDSVPLAGAWFGGVVVQYLAARHSDELEDRPKSERPIGSSVPRNRNLAFDEILSQALELLFPRFLEWTEQFDAGENPEPMLSESDLSQFIELLSVLPNRSTGREPRDFERVHLGPVEARIRQGLAERLERTREPHETLHDVQAPFEELPWTLRERLSTSLWYLGPLREDPSPAYRPGQGGGIARLGLKGEYTVPALERFGSSRIAALLPPEPGQPFVIDQLLDRATTPSLTYTSLREAVDKWMSYLGVASAVRVRATGRAGIELAIVDSQTDVERTLTDVGVGVSQLLPVVVMCLRAEHGDVVLVEQPELHLHPAPQQALGDFLLAMALSGRQLIVETHSEYLINRLRLRMAEDDTQTTAGSVKIIYAERREGKTHFRSIQPNSYGSFDDWPDDFFDQAPKETEAILRAAMSKRRRQRERLAQEEPALES